MSWLQVKLVGGFLHLHEKNLSTIISSSSLVHREIRCRLVSGFICQSCGRRVSYKGSMVAVSQVRTGQPPWQGLQAGSCKPQESISWTVVLEQSQCCDPTAPPLSWTDGRVWSSNGTILWQLRLTLFKGARAFEFWNVSSCWKMLGLELVMISFFILKFRQRLHSEKMALHPKIISACWSWNIQAHILSLKYLIMTGNFISETGHLFWGHSNATKYISTKTIPKLLSGKVHFENV